MEELKHAVTSMLIAQINTHQRRIHMPIAYLDVPQGIRVDEKRQLVQGLYDALHAAYPFPDDVRIFLREWPLESVSQDGHLGSEPARPVFMMHVPQGVHLEAKRKMMQGITAAVAEAYHLPKLMVFMHEYPLDLVSLEGRLHSDNQERVEAQKQAYAGG
jgi:phenylpyruvate tautomerase PptA (4-oxalocrotonate tautomerase family)